MDVPNDNDAHATSADEGADALRTTLTADEDPGRVARRVAALGLVAFGLLCVLASGVYGYLEYMSPINEMTRKVMAEAQPDLVGAELEGGAVVTAVEPYSAPGIGDYALMQPTTLFAIVSFGAAFFLALPKSRANRDEVGRHTPVSWTSDDGVGEVDLGAPDDLG